MIADIKAQSELRSTQFEKIIFKTAETRARPETNGKGMDEAAHLF